MTAPGLSFSVAFDARYHVWFAVRADAVQGEFASIEAAQAKASELNGLLAEAAYDDDPLSGPYGM